MTWSTRFLAVSWGAFVVGLLGWAMAAVYIGMMMPTEASTVGTVGLGWGIFCALVGLSSAVGCQLRGGNATFPAAVNLGLLGVGAVLMASAAVFLG